MDPFLGEIRPLPYTFAPRGWAFCQGQLLSIQQNAALFSILGTQYGGNGTTNFGLPNLQGRAPIGSGQGPGLSQYTQGDVVGAESVTLLTVSMPSHTHSVPAFASSASVTTPGPTTAQAEGHGGGRGGAFNINQYTSQAPGTTLLPSVGPAGGNGPHNNMQPSLVINWCISLQGIFPARN
jgi:microcystin-dependent protein